MKEYLLEISIIKLLPIYLNTITFFFLTLTQFNNYKTSILLNIEISVLEKILLVLCPAMFVLLFCFTIYSLFLKIQA